MPIGMPHVHFANVPGHVGRRPGDLEALLQALLVDGIDALSPDRHPDAFVPAFVTERPERHFGISLPAPTLTAKTQKDFETASANPSESWRVAPIPCLRPSQFFEPGKALLNVGYIQNWCQPFGV